VQLTRAASVPLIDVIEPDHVCLKTDDLAVLFPHSRIWQNRRQRPPPPATAG
jgi:hypothetical protein